MSALTSSRQRYPAGLQPGPSRVCSLPASPDPRPDSHHRRRPPRAGDRRHHNRPVRTTGVRAESPLLPPEVGSAAPPSAKASGQSWRRTLALCPVLRSRCLRCRFGRDSVSWEDQEARDANRTSDSVHTEGIHARQAAVQSGATSSHRSRPSGAAIRSGLVGFLSVTAQSKCDARLGTSEVQSNRTDFTLLWTLAPSVRPPLSSLCWAGARETSRQEQTIPYVYVSPPEATRR